MITRQNLPHWILGLTMLALTFERHWVPVDAIGLSGVVAFAAAVVWAVKT